MPLIKSTLTKMKLDLVSARALVQETAAAARRGGNLQLARRLRNLADALAVELDYIEALVAQLS